MNEIGSLKMSVPEVSALTPVLLPQRTRSSVRLSRVSCLLCNSVVKPLFHLPKNYETQLLWLKSIGKEDLLQTMTHTYIYNNGKLCGLHFSDKDFTSTLRQKLCKIAVPCCIENGKQASPAESSEGNLQNSLSLPESVCRSVEITNFPSSHTGKNSTVVSSSVHNTTSLNKISGKEPFITAKSSLKAGITLLNKVSEKDSVIPAVLSSQPNATSLNNVSGKNSPITDVSASQTDRTSLNEISEKDPLILDASSHSTLLNKVTEKAPKICRTMTNFTSPEMVKDPAVTVITLCCTDRKEGIAFHKFLQDPKQRMRWISAVRCQNTKPTHISVLCPKHFSEEQTSHPSAFKENTVPNVFALDLLSQQKDVNCLQKWNEATPVNHAEGTIKDGFFELQRNPKEIDKFYVKVMYDESVSKIAKRLHSSQTGPITSDTDARKKLKRNKICSPSDPSNLPPQKGGKDLVNHNDVGEKLKKSVVCSSGDTNSNNLSNLNCLQQTPTEELVKHVVASNNSQKDTIDSSSDTNFSDPPDLPMHSPQTNGEETVNHTDERENLKKDTICSSGDTFASTHQIFPMRLPMKARKKLMLYANKKLRKPLEYPPRNIKDEILMHSLKNSGVKRIGNKKNEGQNSLSISGNGEKVDPVSSSNDTERTYCTTGTVTEGRDLIDSSTQTDSAEVIDLNNYHINTEMEERTHVAPKIVDVKGGIDPFNFLDITEIKKFIKVPNEWWGITCTPKYVICSKWNEGYDPKFRVVIEKDYNVKIFIKGRECVSENRKVSLENISALLQEVDSYEICAGVSDKSMTNCMGHLENGSGKPFSIWCKGCQRKGNELMNKYKMLLELQ